MVQFHFATSFTILALLVASVSSTPVPVKHLDVNERDINELRPRGAEVLIKGLTTAFRFLGRLRKSKAGHAVKHINNASGYIPQPQQQQQQPRNRRDLSAQSGLNLNRRDIEERDWGYDDLDARGYFDELD